MSLKKFFIFAVALFGFFCFGMQVKAAHAAVMFVQSTSTTVDSSGPQSLINAFESNVSSGDLILVVVQMYGSDTFNTPTDTFGDTFNQAIQLAPGAAQVNTALFYAIASSGGSDSIGVQFNNNSKRDNFAQYEYSGIASSSPLDVVTSSAQNGATTTWSVGPMMTTSANDLLFVSGGTEAASPSLSAGSGYTMRENNHYTTGDKATFAQEDQIVSSVGSYTGSMTSTPADSNVMVFAAFKAAAGSPPSPPPPTEYWLNGIIQLIGNFIFH